MYINKAYFFCIVKKFLGTQVELAVVMQTAKIQFFTLREKHRELYISFPLMVVHTYKQCFFRIAFSKTAVA